MKDHIYISLRGEVWVHTTSLIRSLFIEVPVSNHGSGLSCVCLLEVSILPLFLSCSGGLEIWCGILNIFYLGGNKRSHGPLYINIISYCRTILYRSQHEYYWISIACTLYIHLYFFILFQTLPPTLNLGARMVPPQHFDTFIWASLNINVHITRSFIPKYKCIFI